MRQASLYWGEQRQTFKSSFLVSLSWWIRCDETAKIHGNKFWILSYGLIAWFVWSRLVQWKSRNSCFNAVNSVSAKVSAEDVVMPSLDESIPWATYKSSSRSVHQTYWLSLLQEHLTVEMLRINLISSQNDWGLHWSDSMHLLLKFRVGSVQYRYVYLCLRCCQRDVCENKTCFVSSLILNSVIEDDILILKIFLTRSRCKNIKMILRLKMKQ